MIYGDIVNVKLRKSLLLVPPPPFLSTLNLNFKFSTLCVDVILPGNNFFQAATMLHLFSIEVIN